MLLALYHMGQVVESMANGVHRINDYPGYKGDPFSPKPSWNYDVLAY